MLVPVGIAYAVASGVPGIYGLYATIVPLLAYALFGPSRILVLGPDSSLAALILAVVLPLSGGDPARAIAVAGLMAVVSGVVCILAGVAAAGIHHRTPVQADPLRLHERHRLRGDRQPVAQAVRDFHRQHRATARPVANRRVSPRRCDQLDHLRHRSARRAGGDPAAQALAAHSGAADRGGGGHGCGRPVRPGRERWREGAR
jgi:hypothetical protein